LNAGSSGAIRITTLSEKNTSMQQPFGEYSEVIQGNNIRKGKDRFHFSICFDMQRSCTIKSVEGVNMKELPPWRKWLVTKYYKDTQDFYQTFL